MHRDGGSMTASDRDVLSQALRDNSCRRGKAQRAGEGSPPHPVSTTETSIATRYRDQAVLSAIWNEFIIQLGPSWTSWKWYPETETQNSHQKLLDQARFRSQCLHQRQGELGGNMQCRKDARMQI
jgi:hypothetical protein